MAVCLYRREPSNTLSANQVADLVTANKLFFLKGALNLTPCEGCDTTVHDLSPWQQHDLSRLTLMFIHRLCLSAWHRPPRFYAAVNVLTLIGPKDQP